MRSLRILISILLISAWPLHARAVQQWCMGTVSYVWVDSGGNLYFVGSWRGDHTIACNVNEPRVGVTPVNCMTWLAILQSAIKRASTVIVFYNEAPACSSLPTYGSAPTPGYVMNVN